MMKNLHMLVCAGLVGLTLTANSQTKKVTEDISASIDSLRGFNEQTFRNIASERGLSTEETEIFVSVSKRQYIKTKFNLEPSASPDILSKVATPACANEDFEDFSFTYSVPYTVTVTTTNGVTGWLSTHTTVPGSSNSSCIIPSIASTGTPNAIWVIAPGPSGYVDALIGPSYPIHSVFGYFANAGGTTVTGDTMKGEWFVKINTQAGYSDLTRISKTMTITPSNANFRFASIAVVEGSHCCCDSPGFDITFKDCSNNVLPIGSYTLAPPQGSGCGGGAMNCQSAAVTATALTCPLNANWKYNQWTSKNVDLSAYIGQCITIEVTSVDCPYGGHGGYVYFDAQCGPSLSTGIASVNAKANGIGLYPNPTAGDFTLNIGKNVSKAELKISNALGQIIFTQSVSNGENKVTIKNLPAGIYYYSVVEGETIVGKGKLIVE